jgi:RimJ/RimL family protein N-acetyltransferase
LEAFQATGADWLARMEKGTDLPLLIRLASSREFLGMATLQYVDTAEPALGIWLKEGAHGKGYGREAGLAILAWVGKVRGAEVLQYPVVAGDIPSKRLAEALGGKKGGSHTLRKVSGTELKVLEYRIDTALAIPELPGR